VHEKIRFKTVSKYDLPYRLSLLYHDCGNYEAKSRAQILNGPPICSNCNKVVPWFFFKCAECDQYFIKDFRHPKFCIFYPTCWQHTLELPWEYCEDHCFPARAPYTGNAAWMNEHYKALVEPVGLNPRSFTDEELANVFEGID
jgi:hypothetical protein